MVEMGQADIIMVLKEAKRPLTVREIAKKLNITASSVGKSLRGLVRFGEVEVAGTISRSKHAKCVKIYRLVRK